VSRSISRYVKAAQGATLIEYALIAALVSIVVAGGVSSLSVPLADTFGEVTSFL
jgi:Flp pilus assembly pilin Flp